jgi:hypothetical protein
MTSSRIERFYRLDVGRRRRLAAALALRPRTRRTLHSTRTLPLEVARPGRRERDRHVRPALRRRFELPDQRRDRVVPMVVEPSVAAASHAALLARAGGGFTAEADAGAMIGQIRWSVARPPRRRNASAWRGRLLAAAAA